MRRLLIVSLIALAGCSWLSDLLVPDIPRAVFEAQDRANGVAFGLLGQLHQWVNDPGTIPPGSASDVHLQIDEILVDLRFVRDWMLEAKVDEKVSQTVIDLLVAWQDYVDKEFCTDNAWLDNPVPMTSETQSAWAQVFTKITNLHHQLHVWMEEKGIKDD